jgi:hypothetical protein
MPKAGKITFNFSDFQNVTYCKLRLRRISGNGKLIVTVNNKPKTVVVAARNLVYSVDLSEDKQVEISRPPDSLGEVLITSIAFDSDGVKEPQVSINWKQLISNCGKYTCLRLIKGRLYASTGGLIERGDKIRRIETDPPMSYKHEGGKIVFKNSCEITHLSLAGPAEPIQQSKQLFVERLPPQQIEVAQNEPPTPREVIARPGAPRPAPTHVVDGSLAGLEDDVVFDTNTISIYKIVTVRSKVVKAIKSLGKEYLLLKPGAHFSIPISRLEPTKNYIAIMYGKSINGNGKMRIGLSSGDHYYGDIKEILFGKGANSKYISVNSDRGTPGQAQRLHLMLPAEVCTGEVLISRIVIINNIDIHNSGRQRYNVGVARERPQIQSDGTFNLAISESSTDEYYRAAKKYARYYPQAMDNVADQVFKGSVAIASDSGMAWFHKMKTMFPGIRLDKGKDSAGISMSQSGFIKKKDHVWLDATDEIHTQDIKDLQDSKMVFSPSIKNCQQLRDMLPSGIDVELMRKPLPWVTSKPIPLFEKMEYVVAINRSPESTSMIVAAWTEKLPKLVILGVRGNFPNYVIPTNEYLQFSQMVFMLTNAKCVIDLPPITDYESSMLALTEAVGTPAVTTNWSAMGKDSALFLASDKEKRYIPSTQALVSGVQEACQMNVTQSNRLEYNDNEMGNFKRLFRA